MLKKMVWKASLMVENYMQTILAKSLDLCIISLFVLWI